MKAALSVWKSNPENHLAVLEILQNAHSMKDNKGCISVLNIADYEHNMFGHISVWETQQDLDTYHQQRDKDNPDALGNLMALVAEMKAVGIFDVVESKE